jgi:hypothetical protein
MSNVNGPKEPTPTSNGGNGSEAGAAEGPSSLDRLADFTRRLLRVSKDELKRMQEGDEEIKGRAQSAASDPQKAPATRHL